MAHEVIARITFESEAQAIDLMNQIQARMTNARVSGIGTPRLSSSYAQRRNDGVLAAMLYVDEWGIVRQGEYVAREVPIWVQPTGGHDAYPLLRLDGQPTRVLHNGTVWQNNTANNVWVPGVFGWDAV